SIIIANRSTTTAGVIVSGQNQVVGGIDGPGNLSITDGGSLTANHITAGSLVIGNGGVFSLAPTDASGNPLASSDSSSRSAGAEALSSLATGPSVEAALADSSASMADSPSPPVSTTAAFVTSGPLNPVAIKSKRAASSQTNSVIGDCLVKRQFDSLRH